MQIETENVCSRQRSEDRVTGTEVGISLNFLEVTTLDYSWTFTNKYEHSRK